MLIQYIVTIPKSNKRRIKRMESLSIKKTGKVFLAVALVIFMLVALLGLSLYGHTAAAASADGADIVISAAFSAS